MRQESKGQGRSDVDGNCVGVAAHAHQRFCVGAPRGIQSSGFFSKRLSFPTHLTLVSGGGYAASTVSGPG